MKIKHWKQLKDFSESEISKLRLNDDRIVHTVFRDGTWELWSIYDIFCEGVTEVMGEWYIKDVEKPELPFTVKLKSGM